MASATDLHAELILLASTSLSARLRRISFHAVMNALYERLLRFPEEADLLPSGPLFDLRERRALEAADGFRFNNVHLSWPAANAPWRWPPEDFAAYDAMLERELPGLRVIGAGWGMSKLTHPKRGGGLLITAGQETALQTPVRWKDPGSRVRCMLGATFRDVNEFLYAEAPARSLANQPGFADLSVAGCIGAGGHGSSIGLGPLASMVESITLPPAQRGDDAVEIPRSDPRFDYVTTHLGRLGPILAMDLAARSRYRIHETRTLCVLGKKKGWRTELQDLVERAVHLQERDHEVHSTEIWIAPYVDDGELVTVLGTRTRTDDAPRGGRPAVIRSRALQVLGQLAVSFVSIAEPDWIRGVLRRTVRATVDDDAVLEAPDGLDFGAPNDNPMGAIEMAIDISSRIDATPIVRVIDALEALSRSERFVFSPMGVRFVGRGPDHGLGPHQGRTRTMHIEIPTFADEHLFHGDEVLPSLQRLLAGLGGRPHWGQRIYLSPDELRALWPAEEIEAMRRVVLERDPAGLFANDLVDQVLGIP